MHVYDVRVCCKYLDHVNDLFEMDYKNNNGCSFFITSHARMCAHTMYMHAVNDCS